MKTTKYIEIWFTDKNGNRTYIDAVNLKDAKSKCNATGLTMPEN